eukprot:15452319-Alexandrium_andersonii.AAC.1
MDLRSGVLRLSPTRSCGEGCLARGAHWDRRPFGLDFGPRAHFDQPLPQATNSDLRSICISLQALQAPQPLLAL